MKVSRKRCAYCRRPFKPNPRARIQRCCGSPACRRARKRRNLRRWRSLHPEHGARYAAKERAWAKAYPNYWRKYRAENAAYRARDNARRAAALKRERRSANETGKRRSVVEKLRALDALGDANCSANETGFLRRVDAIEDCLRSTVAALCSAK